MCVKFEVSIKIISRVININVKDQTWQPYVILVIVAFQLLRILCYIGTCLQNFTYLHKNVGYKEDGVRLHILHFGHGQISDKKLSECRCCLRLV